MFDWLSLIRFFNLNFCRTAADAIASHFIQGPILITPTVFVYTYSLKGPK